MILELLHRITKSLDENQIAYMLSGSVAMSMYAVPRMTLDIDLIIELNQYNQSEFYSLFKSGYYIDQKTVEDEVIRKGMFNIIDLESGYKIDFIIRKDTDYRKLEFSRRKAIEVKGFKVWVVSPEDLIISKIEWIQQLQSPKQVDDIKNLLRYLNLDIQYVKEWCNKLKLNTFNLL